MAASSPPTTLATRLAAWCARHAGPIVLATLAATALLAVPFLTMAPDGFASQEPEGRVFEARDAVDERFGAGVVDWAYIVEAPDGELLDAEGLGALHERVEAVRDHPELGPLLVRRGDPALGELAGTLTLADATDAALVDAGLGGLADAPDDAVRTVASQIVDERGAVELNLSRQARRDEETGWWSAPAAMILVAADGEQIDGRGSDGGFGSDVATEAVARDVQDVLRGGDLDVWGIAIDQTLTGEEQGQAAGPFIGFTVLALVLLVGVAFRSYWVLAVTGAALIALLVWLGGLSNLLGLAEDQILATVVPIAMLAFGVDYAFHALGRYREEGRGARIRPRLAVGRGLGGVLPALVLALGTGVAAFLANTASGIESIVQFGIAAAGALVAAFVVLGVVVPLAVAWIDERLGAAQPRWASYLALVAGPAAAAAAMAAVLFALFLAPPVGLALAAGYVVVFLALPLAVAVRRARRAAGQGAAEDAAPTAPASGRLPAGIAAAVSAVAARRVVVLPVVALASLGAMALAVQVPASFDVEDFFAADTDFVVGLDKLDEHVGDQGGEQATVFVEADLTDPVVVAELDAFAERLRGLDTDRLARGSDGAVTVEGGMLDLLAAAGLAPPLREAQLSAFVETALAEGVVAADGTVAATPAEAAQVLAPPAAADRMVTRLRVGLVGSRAQENVAAADAVLTPLVTELEASLQERDPGAQAVLTGTPLIREASLAAVSRALATSLPIALVLCFVGVAAFLRSVRYAVVSIVPIVLVVAWLYGFMTVAGFSVNLVTATIGAISIGVGIDFATHVTMRYREELAAATSRLAALRAAAAGTGTALVGSAATSIVGFAILAFAPMPMFAAFGLLTAVMIALALAASLLVLPALLVLVSDEPTPVEPTASSAALETATQ